MVNRLFRKMLPSQILSSLAIAICMQVDIILIGQFLGVEGVSSYGFVNPVLFAFSAISGLLSVGISTVCSRFIGKGDKNSINSNFSSIIVFTILLSIVFTIVIFIACNPLVTLLGAEPGTSTFAGSVEYLKGYAIGIPAYLLMTMLTAFLQLAGKRKLVVTSIVVMTILDIALDILSGAVFHWGMFGMGIATSISEIGAFIVVLIYFLKKDSMYKLNLKMFSFSQIGNTALVGTPIALNQICYTIFIVVMNHLLLQHGGTNAVAAFSVLASLSSVCFTISNGVGITTQILTGIFFGEQDRKNIVKAMKLGLLWGIILNTIVAIIVLILKKPIASIYVTDNAEALQMTVAAISIYIFAIIPMGIVVLFKNYYPCRGKLQLALFTSLGENLVFSIGIAFILSVPFGFYGLIAASFWNEVLAVVLICLMTWIINKKVSFKLEDFFILPDNLLEEGTQVTGFQIRNLEEVSTVAEEAGKFCVDKGCSNKLSMYISLCIEEMACEIIERGFKEKKDNLIDVRIMQFKDEWVIRIKDNCDDFDPVSYMKLHDNEDNIAHLGIRMVFKLVTDAQYINSLGLNCLTMKLKVEA